MPVEFTEGDVMISEDRPADAAHPVAMAPDNPGQEGSARVAVGVAYGANEPTTDPPLIVIAAVENATDVGEIHTVGTPGGTSHLILNAAMLGASVLGKTVAQLLEPAPTNFIFPTIAPPTMEPGGGIKEVPHPPEPVVEVPNEAFTVTTSCVDTPPLRSGGENDTPPPHAPCARSQVTVPW